MPSRKPSPPPPGSTRLARRRRALLPLVLGAALLAILVAAWYGARAFGSRRDRPLSAFVSPAAARGYNLLLITLDTVRADRIGCYGYAAAETPTIDALAREGIRCAAAVASTPLTLPSHATILTGLYPPRHGARDNGLFEVAREPRTLAESFHEQGYATAAFIGSFVLDERYGLARGFETYDFAVGGSGFRPQMVDFNERPATEVTDAVLGWLRERKGEGTRPFFAWVHYFDPHEPYLSPLEREARFAGRPYDAEIAYVDRELGRLLRELEGMGARERTVVVLAADHGDSFQEHGEPTHGMLLYDSTLRVPVIFSAPGLLPAGRVVSGQLVGLVDLAPTLRSLFALEEVSADGLDLLRAPPDPRRAVYLETLAPYHFAGWSPLHGLRTLQAKFVLAPSPEFYDLARDPGEAHNLLPSAHPEAARLDALLAEMRGAWSGQPIRERGLSDEEYQRLASLGYIQMEGQGAVGGLADPKRMMGVYKDGLEAEALYQQGRYEEAAKLAEGVVSRCPDLAQAVRVLAFSHLRLNRVEAGLAVLREACRRREDVFLLRSLAQALILNQRLDEARAVLARYGRAAPRDGRVALLEGDILLREGKTAEALASFRRAAEIDPNRTGPMAQERLRQAETRETR